MAEEIGDPDLFVGREQEMKRLLKWAEGTKRRRAHPAELFVDCPFFGAGRFSSQLPQCVRGVPLPSEPPRSGSRSG
ncbi:MAG: hypothetical protein GY856_50480 [bacterium]|nr:hypothetical protein [bacterium]